MIGFNKLYSITENHFTSIKTDISPMDNPEIRKLISEEKFISNTPPKDFKDENQHYRKDFDVLSADGQRKFSVFLRKNKTFQENFSIGLRYYLPEGGNLILIRLNGNHGQVINNPLRPSPHFGYHIHQMTSDAIERGLSDPEFAEETKEYASFEQALSYFCKRVNIKNAVEFFPALAQTELFPQ
jgi:hypothetical protein